MGSQRNKRKPVARAAKAADLPVSSSMCPMGLRPKPKPCRKLLEPEKPAEVDTSKVSKTVNTIQSNHVMSSLMPEGGSAAVPDEESDSDDKCKEEESDSDDKREEEDEDEEENEEEDDAECVCHFFPLKIKVMNFLQPLLKFCSTFPSMVPQTPENLSRTSLGTSSAMKLRVRLVLKRTPWTLHTGSTWRRRKSFPSC